MLESAGIAHHVCVATDYGEKMMTPGPLVSVHTGRMDEEAMRAFLSGLGSDVIVIDATHPYAKIVTGNIQKAAGDLGLYYIRVARDRSSSPAVQGCIDNGENGSLCVLPECSATEMIGTSANISQYASIRECAAALSGTEGGILLTTGSKELPEFTGNASAEVRSRIYARVLPSAKSIEACENAGIAPGRIIAMQGPASREMNEALIREYGIAHVITKDSGRAGGFAEKIQAAENTGAHVHVIARPDDVDGVSIEEAYRIVIAECRNAAGTDGYTAENPRPHILISLIGIGPGGGACITKEASDAIAGTDALFGAARLLSGFDCERKYEMYRAADIIPVLSEGSIRNAAVVFSGDSGYRSGAANLLCELKKWDPSADIKVIPGISSFSYLASRLGVSYDDACLLSLHGKDSDRDIEELAEKIKHNAITFVLLSNAGDVPRIAQKLIAEGIKGQIAAGSDLSYESEKISSMTFAEALGYESDGVVTIEVFNSCPG